MTGLIFLPNGKIKLHKKQRIFYNLMLFGLMLIAVLAVLGTLGIYQPSNRIILGNFGFIIMMLLLVIILD